jgi:hypothetical protein
LQRIPPLSIIKSYLLPAERLHTLYITKTIAIGKNDAQAGYLHANAGKWNLIRDNIVLYKPNIRIISFALDINTHF